MIVLAPHWTHLLPEMLPVAVAVLRADDGSVVYANRAFEKLVGVAEVEGRRFPDLVNAPDANQTLTASTVTDVRGRRADGGEYVAEATVEPFSVDADDDALLVTLVDVSEQRGLAGALADIARFPDMNPGPVLRTDPDGIVLRVNPAAATVFGEDIVGSRWSDRCMGLTPEAWRGVLDGTQDRLVLEVEIDGALLQLIHLRADDAESVFIFGADITGRRQAEKELAETARKLAEVARFPDMNPGPVLRLDLDGQVLLANRAAHDLFGDAVLGRRWAELYPAGARRWEEILSATSPVSVEARLAGREYVFAHRMDPRSGLVFVYGYDVTAQRNAERALRQSEKMATLGTLVAGVAHELNNPAAATRRAAQQLRDALATLHATQRRLEAMALPPPALALLRSLELMAHEQDTRDRGLDPVTRGDLEADIEDWLDNHGVADPEEHAPVLVEQGVTPARLDELTAGLDTEILDAALPWGTAALHVYRLAHEIGTGSERISEIVRALRSYSYLGQGPQQAVDLHEGLDDTVVILRHKLKQGIEVRREYASDIPPIPAYGSELNQVWTNLIDNAADAMGGRGVITIRTRVDEPWAVVDIEDTGPGVDPDHVAQVFDPFFTTKAPGEGTGLGLSTSYAIVTEKHLGQMAVDSEQGRTRFTVRLPLRPDGDRD